MKKSLELFTKFMLREIVDEQTGQTYNNIGKVDQAVRLYNAPWVIMYFCEWYLFTREERYIDLVIRMIRFYYQQGGANFYPNGFGHWTLAQAVKLSGKMDAYEEVLRLFDTHVDSIMEKGIHYPPHEVNYEQTIVTPAVMILLNKYLLCKEEKYLREAEKHLKLLIKFNGCQPDYRLNKAAIRYWDNYWFGKTISCSYGDTLHLWTVLSAKCFYTYGKITGQKKWMDYGKQELENLYCFFNTKGEASSAYVYPERVNGNKGQYFDSFANEQDGVLYFAYKILE